MPQMINPYFILGSGMHRACADATLRDRFKFLAKGLHPDKPSGDKDKFVALVQAYRMVETADKRAELAKRMDFIMRACRTCRTEGYVRGAFVRGHMPTKVACQDCNGCGYN